MDPHSATEFTRIVQGRKQVDQLREALARFPGRRVLLVLDGLDEIAERDPSFADEIPFALCNGGATWLCAGRETGVLLSQFSSMRCRHVFPGGLPRMSTEDVRTMLLERIGSLRQRLLRNDEEHGEEVINPFIERVADRAQGLPIYVRYVIGDIMGNRYRALDAGERLPPSLDQYHADMLRRCGVGAMHQVLTPIVASIAVAHEALTPNIVAELLLTRNLATEKDLNGGLVTRALSALGAMLRRSSTPEGEAGFTLFHHSLREHMEQSAEMRGVLQTARQAFAAMVLDQSRSSGPAARYFFRWGVSHLTEAGRHQEAIALLCSFDYMMRRLDAMPERGTVYGISADWRRVGNGCSLGGDAADWEAHWRHREHLLLHATPDWPASRIFHQLCLDRARTGPWRTAALAWQPAGDVPAWTTLVADERDLPVTAIGEACVGVLVGHSDTVNACRFLADGSRLVSASGNRFDDFGIRVWGTATHECLAVLRGHRAPVLALDCSRDGTLCASGDRVGRVLVWNLDSGAVLHDLSAHKGPAVFVGVSRDGTALVTAGRDGRVMLWDIEKGCLSRDLELGSPVTCGTSDASRNSVALGLTDGRVLLLDSDGPKLARTFDAFPGSVVSVALSADGTTLAASGPDGKVCCWNVDRETRLATWSQDPDSVTALALTRIRSRPGVTAIA